MRTPMVIHPFLAFAVAVLACHGGALAQDGAASDEPLRFVHEPWSGQAADEVAEPAIAFGQKDFDSWIVSYSAAYTGEALDQGFTLGYSEFLVDDIEWFLEGGLWSFYDRGRDAAFGLSASLGFRWHFIQEDRWSIFADVGIGVLGTTDHVPPDGTSFNFMPRAGVGFTRQIDEDIRLIGGVRWHHISNARTRGDSRNPARDAPQIYVGLVIPF
ncbi:MAG: acyloxyacyl hydrolase [Phycisphaerales bacterium]|jgi:lipid A 3-O-deacylase